MSLRFIRRGRASRPKKHLDDDLGDSDFEELDSDVELDELRDWMSTTASQNPLLPHQVLVRKYLPPGTVADLFEHYKATQMMLGAACVSYLGHCRLSFSMFFNLHPNTSST